MSRSRKARVHPGLAGAGDVLALVSPTVGPDAVTALGVPRTCETWLLTAPVPAVRDRDAVVLVVRDLSDLRRSITAVASIGAARTVAVLFERPVERLPTVVPRAQWALQELAAVREPHSSLVLRFAEHTPVRLVLMDLARAAAPSGRLAVGWPALGVRRPVPGLWPPADPGAKVAVLDRVLDQQADLPPDLVLVDGEAGERVAVPSAPHHVLGRPTAVTVLEPDLTWDQWRALPPGEAARALAARGPASLGPVDDQVRNPIGFERDPAGGLTPPMPPDKAGLPVTTPVDDATVAAARRLGGVRVDWTGARGPQDYCRWLLQLAAAGVPLVSDGTPEWAGHLLPPDLVAALDRPADLADRMAREEHSVRVRRAALTTFAASAWRRGLARAHGLQEGPEARVSILLATRRPEMLPFALRQVCRQRGVGEVEVVLAAHGFDPDPGQLAAVDATPGFHLTPVRAESSEPFGAVLARAARVAGGDLLLKMDDDDWYGPDFLADLLLARGYSGADVVGCSAELTYLAELGLTTRQVLPTEVYRPLVAGGTMLVERAAYDAVGGFRSTLRYVDAGLLGAVRDSGGTTYRSHGLGYVLRRAPSGHTWDPGVGYFLTGERAAEQWRGFRPSALLEPEEVDRPTGGDVRVGRR